MIERPSRNGKIRISPGPPPHPRGEKAWSKKAPGNAREAPPPLLSSNHPGTPPVRAPRNDVNLVSEPPGPARRSDLLSELLSLY
jgi:hypothetical protein